MRKTLVPPLFSLLIFSLFFCTCDNPLIRQITDPRTITFEANGGSYVEGQTVLRNYLVKKPHDPSKDGCLFEAWYSDNETFENAWDFNTAPEGDLTLYANWSVMPGFEIYTVTFDKNGGDTDAIPAVRETANGKAVTAPETPPARTGYTFAGWYKEAECENEWDFAADTVTADITLYAKWEISRYTVTFDSGGGSEVGPVTGAAHGATIAAPGEPARAAYIFGGWYKEAECENEWDFEADAVTADITLYAKWEISPSAGFAGIALSVEQIEEGAPVIAGITVSRTGTGSTFTVTVPNAADYASIRWEIAGAGAYRGETVAEDGASFKLDGTDVKYNTIGGHTLKLVVEKGGLSYQANIEFTVEP